MLCCTIYMQYTCNITDNNAIQTSQCEKRTGWLSTIWRTSFKFDTSHVAIGRNHTAVCSNGQRLSNVRIPGCINYLAAIKSNCACTYWVIYRIGMSTNKLAERCWKCRCHVKDTGTTEEETFLCDEGRHAGRRNMERLNWVDGEHTQTTSGGEKRNLPCPLAAGRRSSCTSRTASRCSSPWRHRRPQRRRRADTERRSRTPTVSQASPDRSSCPPGRSRWRWPCSGPAWSLPCRRRRGWGGWRSKRGTGCRRSDTCSRNTWRISLEELPWSKFVCSESYLDVCLRCVVACTGWRCV